MTTPENDALAPADDEASVSGQDGEVLDNMGDDIGPALSGARGGGGLGPAAVREDSDPGHADG